MGAPVCNISPKNPPPQSKAPALPSIPVATDLQSAIAAVNALRQLTIQYFNQVPPSTNTTNGPMLTDFTEIPAARVVTTTNIYDPNDPTGETFVTVAQITGLKFANQTGPKVRCHPAPGLEAVFAKPAPVRTKMRMSLHRRMLRIECPWSSPTQSNPVKVGPVVFLTSCNPFHDTNLKNTNGKPDKDSKGHEREF